jgi:hypothetical protein
MIFLIFLYSNDTNELTSSPVESISAIIIIYSVISVGYGKAVPGSIFDIPEISLCNMIEVISRPRIRSYNKAQADKKAQHTFRKWPFCTI